MPVVVVVSFLLSVGLGVTGVFLNVSGSTIEGSVYTCVGALGLIISMSTGLIVTAIRENNNKKES